MNRQTLQAKESAPAKKKSSFSWLRPAAAHPAAEAEYEAPSASSSSFAHDFTKVPVRPMQLPGVPGFSCPFAPQRCPSGGACHTCPPKMQAKLKIGQPGDRYEQEADRVAETVMRMPEPQVQRKCSAPGCKDEDDEKKLLQTKSAGSAGNAQVDHPLIQSVLSSPGQPLDAGTRSFMEPRFGQDFSGVRVHLGGEAAESARAVNARAYTVGRDVVFGEGQYAPGSDEGKRLMAHELVHVGQNKNVLEVRPFIFRQIAGTTGTPGGSDPCFDLLQQIIELLNEVAQRFNDALDDRHNLFRDHRGIRDAHPDYGSWDGHRNRFNYDRDRLRQKISEWESNDDCRNYRFSPEQQEDFNEAYEFKEREFPVRPVRTMREMEPEPNIRNESKIREMLPSWLLALLSAAALAAIVACFASGVCEFGIVVAGLSAAAAAAAVIAVLNAAGVRDSGNNGNAVT